MMEKKYPSSLQPIQWRKKGKKTIVYRTVRVSNRKIGVIPTKVINNALQNIAQIRYVNRGERNGSVVVKFMHENDAKTEHKNSYQDRGMDTPPQGLGQTCCLVACGRNRSRYLTGMDSGSNNQRGCERYRNYKSNKN